MEKPKIISGSPDLADLKVKCEEYMDFISGDDYNEDKLSDYDARMVEAALTALYGKDVFKYINEKMV